MSYDLRLVIEGYVEHCINQKAQEGYLAKLNAQLDELESKADKWDEKETPYKVDDFGLLNTRVRYGICKCTGAVSESELYCWNCGQKLDFESEGE